MFGQIARKIRKFNERNHLLGVVKSMNGLKRMLLLFLMMVGIGSAFGQGSSSSDFKLTVKFEAAIPVADVYSFYYKMAGNDFDRIQIKKDTVLNELVISGHNSYIHVVHFPTLVFTYTEKVLDSISEEHFTRTRQFLLFSNSFETYNSTVDVDTFEFSIEKPNILVDMERRPNEFTVIQESTYGMFNSENFQHVFIGNELISIDAN